MSAPVMGVPAKSYFARVTDPSLDLDGMLVQLERALTHFDEQYRDGRDDLDIEGQKIWDVSKRLAGWMALRYEQYRELCAIQDFLEMKKLGAYTEKLKMYSTAYQKTLTDAMAKNYAVADEDVLLWVELIISVKLLVEKYEGLTKGIETLEFQINTLARMREAQIEDATI